MCGGEENCRSIESTAFLFLAGPNSLEFVELSLLTEIVYSLESNLQEMNELAIIDGSIPTRLLFFHVFSLEKFMRCVEKGSF